MRGLDNSKKTFYYILLSYVATLFNTVLSLFLIRELSYSQLGRVTLGKSMFQSFEFSHIGLRYGLDRILPRCKSENIRNIYFSVAFLFSLFSSLIFCLFWFFYSIKEVAFYAPFIVAGLLYTAITLYKIYYRSYEEKSVFLQISFWILLFPILIQLLGLYIFNFYGYIISYLLSYLISGFIVYYKFKIDIVFDAKKYYSVLKIIFSKGYLLFVSVLFSFLSSTGDRFFIEKYWGLENLGIYSVAMFFFSALGVFANSYTEMIMSKIVSLKSFKYVLRHLCFVAVLTIVMVVLVDALTPYFVSLFMPDYLEQIDIIQYALWATVPFSLTPILNYHLHAMDKRNVLLIINIVCTCIYFILLIPLLLRDVNLYGLVWLKNLFYTILMFATLLFSIYYREGI